MHEEKLELYLEKYNKKIIKVKEEKELKFLGPVGYTYINVYFDKIIIKKGFKNIIILFENLDTIYLVEKKHFNKHRFINNYLIIVKYKENNKDKELKLEYGIENKNKNNIYELFNCFEYRNNNNNNYYKYFLDSIDIIKLFILMLIFIYIIINFFNNRYINLDKYNLCDVKFYEDERIYIFLKQEEVLNIFKNNNLGYIIINNKNILNQYENIIKKTNSKYTNEIINRVEEKYKQSIENNKILVIVVAQNNSGKLYYKNSFNKIRLLLKESSSIEINKTGIYMFFLDKNNLNNKFVIKK